MEVLEQAGISPSDIRRAQGKRGLERQLTRSHGDSARQAIRVGMILKRLQDHIEGKQELSNTQALAAKTLLDRALPTLTSVELVTSEELPAEGELIGRILSILAANPSLRQRLIDVLVPVIPSV